MSRADIIDQFNRLTDTLDENRLVMTTLQFARSGHATDVMVEQAIALVDRQIITAKEAGDEGMLRPALNLKSGLEKALLDGVK